MVFFVFLDPSHFPFLANMKQNSWGVGDGGSHLVNEKQWVEWPILTMNLGAEHSDLWSSVTVSTLIASFRVCLCVILCYICIGHISDIFIFHSISWTCFFSWNIVLLFSLCVFKPTKIWYKGCQCFPPTLQLALDIWTNGFLLP